MTSEERIKIPSKNSVITFVILVVILGAVLLYVSFVNLFTERRALQTSMETAIATEPVTKDLNVDVLENEQYAELENYGTKELNSQNEIQPYNETAPSAPKHIRVTDPALGKVLYIFWELSNPPAENVNIYRSATKDVKGIKIGSVAQAKGSYTDAKVENNITYYYTLTSSNGTSSGGKESKPSEQFSGLPTDTTPPPPPTDIKVENGGDGTSAVITWKNSTDEDFAYVKIYRSEKKGELGAEIKSKLTTETYQDEGLDQNMMYYYTLTSVDTNNNESSTKLDIPASGRDNPFEPAE